MIISAAITIVGITLLPPSAIIPIIVYVVVGALVPVGMKFYRRRHGGDYAPVLLGAEDKDLV